MRIGGKAGLCGLVVGMVLGTVSAADAAPLGAATTSNTGKHDTTTVTLITGDRVVVRDGTARSVLAGDGRDGMTFSTFTREGHSYVVPADARRLLTTGRLDRRLFDVTQLVEFGYDDASRDTMPLIVSHPAGRATPRIAGTTATRELDSIDAVAIAAAKSEATATWDALTDGGTARTTAAGVSKVWLDGKRRSTLDHSTDQIGAPVAWEAGLTGEGTTVAVLDTGVDQTHPDLADREIGEQNFTDAPDNVDNFGHGTHVASIVAGTGAKSDGRYRGVAWGASILDGKVLDDNGFGMESWIVAGMEWAAEQGAQVANLSLGGGDTPGLDPMEEAVNTLSAEYGTLFVIAAGNSGPRPETVGSPGSAEAALTVGAVDRDDAIASFSSRGPRVGDGGIKPDVTAPGVDIVAASHAAGTIAPPVADGYTALSGTSMATPHVAGVAALLAQRHPDWTGDRLKAVLSASAAPAPGLTAFDQGSGRVDVPAALETTIVSEPTGLGLGTVAWPHDDDEPVARELTYRNLGDGDVTLSLAVEATGPDGAPAELFSLSAGELTVPAGGTAAVTITGDTRLGTVDGAYSGAVVATAGESVTRTPVAITREVESYDLTVNLLGQDGGPTGSGDTMLMGIDNDTFAFLYDEDGSAEIRVPKGRYLLHHTIVDGGRASLLARPGLVVDRDLTVTADARTARPLRITPPEPLDLMLADIGFVLRMGEDLFGMGYLTDDLSTVSTAQLGEALPGTTLTGSVSTQWLDDTGDFYGLAWFSPGEFPTGLTKVVDRRDLATVRVDIGPAADELTGLRAAFPSPREGGAGGFAAIYEVPTPGNHTAHLSTEGGVLWGSLFLLADQQGDFVADLSSADVAYRAGRTYRAPVNHAVFGPALPRWADPWGTRTGDELNIAVPLFGDAAGNAGFSAVESGGTKLYLGDEVIGENPFPGGGQFGGLPAEEREYRLTTEAVRPDIFDTTTALSAEWTFRSSRVDGERPGTVDLNAVRYHPALDRDNTAPAGRPHLVPVQLQDESGATQLPRSLRIDVSYDDGATWQRVPVLLNVVAVLHHPAGAKSVSLRAAATDRDGNTVKQTLVRAYQLRE